MLNENLENDDDFQLVDSHRDSKSVQQQHLDHHPYSNEHVQDYECVPLVNAYQPYQPYQTYDSFTETPVEWPDTSGYDASLLQSDERAIEDAATYGLDFDSIALPSDMDPKDPIFHLCDAKSDAKATPMDKIRSANRLTAIRGVCKEPNDPFDRTDVLCMLQAIAEGKASGSDLPSAMKQYIVDTIGEKKLSNIMAGGKSSESQDAGRRPKGHQLTQRSSHANPGPHAGARHQSAVAKIKKRLPRSSHVNGSSTQGLEGKSDSSSLLNQLTYVDGQAYLNGVPVLEKTESSEHLDNTGPLYNTTASTTASKSFGKPSDTTSAIESIDAVALGRMFAAQHGGSLEIKTHPENTGGAMPFVSDFPNPLISEYQPAKQQPTGISEYFRQVRGLEQPRASPARAPTMADNPWSFPRDMPTVSSSGGNAASGGRKAKVDLGSLLKPGIPTPGEMKHLFEAKYNGFDSDCPGPRSFMDPNCHDKVRPIGGPMKKIDSAVGGFDWMNDPTLTVAYNNPLHAPDDQVLSFGADQKDDCSMDWCKSGSGDFLGQVGDSFDNDWEFS